MNNFPKPKRSSDIILRDDELPLFYKILQFYESDRSSYGRENILKQSAKKCKPNAIFEFIHDDYEQEMQSPSVDTFYFNTETKGNGNSGRNNNSVIVKKWFAHLRNSFAHNYIKKEKVAIWF